MHHWYSRPAHRRRIDGPRRTLIAALGVLATLLAAGALVPLTASAEDGPRAFGMSMVTDTGHFMIAGNEPGAPLGDPTSVSGTYDPATGDFSDVSFSSPMIHVVQQVTDPFPVTVTINQQLQQLGTGSGHVAENGDVSLDLTFKLYVDITASIAHGICYSQPIDVHLTSTAPYDPTTGRVNLKAEGFNLPNLQQTDQCGSLITDNAGKQFAGSNNRLELTLEGDLNAQLAESTTALAVSPVSPVKAGTSSTLTATVGPEGASGDVSFYDGDTLLGTGTLNSSGVATLAKKLDAGTHQLNARYAGNGDFTGSTAASTEYVVQANPDFGTEFPATLVPGASPKEFTITVNNPTSGVDQNLRVDLSINQVPSDTSAGGLNITPSQLSLEMQDGDGNWQPVTLTQTPQTYSLITASLGANTGFALAPGAQRQIKLRMATAVGTVKRTLSTTAILNAVNPGTGAITSQVQSMGGTIIVPPASRVDAASITATVLGGTPGQTLARGYLLPVSGTVQAPANVAGQAVNPVPSGVAQVLIDGNPTSTMSIQPTVPAGGLRIPVVTQGAVTLGTGGFAKEFIDTQDLSVGTHTVQVQYFGDTNYKDGISPATTFTVTPAWGAVYDCTFTPLAGQSSGRMIVSGVATLPGAVASGSTVSITDADVRIGNQVYPGGNGGGGLQNPVGNLAVGLNPNGTLNKAGNTSVVTAAAGGTTDNRAYAAGMSASVTVQGQPGDVVDVTVGSLSFNNGPLKFGASCAPLDQPARIGSVTIAGTTLTVTPGGTAAHGDQVTLTAAVKPATNGQVEFFDGTTSLGVVPVTAGKAVLTTGNLTGGVHQLSARHSGGSITANGAVVSVAPNVSNVVEQVVRYDTRTTLTASSTQVVSGPVTLTAAVATDPASSAVPGGAVQFKVDGNPVGSPVALSGGQAQLTTQAIPAGPHQVTAAYAGNDAFGASTSAPVTVTVGKVITSMTVAPANGALVSLGLYFKLTNASATLVSPAGPVVGRAVTFRIGGQTACTATTNAAGVATCTGQVGSIAALLATSYTATFTGDAAATAVTGSGSIVR